MWKVFFCWDTIIRIGVSIGESFRNMLPFFSLLLREGERVKGAFGAFQRLDPFELQKHIGLFFFTDSDACNGNLTPLRYTELKRIFIFSDENFVGFGKSISSKSGYPP